MLMVRGGLSWKLPCRLRGGGLALGKGEFQQHRGRGTDTEMCDHPQSTGRVSVPVSNLVSSTSWGQEVEQWVTEGRGSK